VAEVSLEVASAYGLEGRFAAFEIDCEPLFAGYPYPPRVLPVPRYPATSRDVALVVPDDIPAAQVLDTLRAEAGVLLESIELFDVYRGGNIPEGSRSLAYSLVYRAQDRTLKDSEVDELHENVRKAVITKLGAVVR
jgi:phenylalanyl-tRNA synthetase beta chain